MQRAGKEGALPLAPPLSGANVQAMPVHQHQQGQYVGNPPTLAQQQGIYIGNHPMPAQQQYQGPYAGNQEEQADEAMHVGMGVPNPNIGHTGRFQVC